MEAGASQPAEAGAAEPVEAGAAEPAGSPHAAASASEPEEPARTSSKGELVFRSDFESGNLGSTEEVNPQSEWDIMLRPDTNNPKYRVWFYFSVENVRRRQVVTFNVTNFSKTKSLYREGMTPLVRSTSRPHWQRIPMRNTFYYKCPRHEMRYVLSFVFEFDNEDDTYFFAYSYPYTYSQLQRYLLSMQRLNLPFFRRTLLCRTVQHRRMDVVIIGSDLLHFNDRLQPHPSEPPPPKPPGAETPAGEPLGSGEVEEESGGKKEEEESGGRKLPPEESGGRKGGRPKAPRRVVFVSARVHPGETPASYMCHGLLDFLIGPDPAAKALRKAVTFVVVPMLNPDGVFLGNYRCSTSGVDLNRQWAEPSETLDPENYHVKDLLRSMGSDPGISLDFVLDLHAHSTSMNAFCYVNLLDNDMAKMQKELIFLRLLANNCKMFSLNNSRVCCDPTKVGTGRRALPEVLEEHTHCYTMEVSFFCYHTMATRPIPFTMQSYIQCGRTTAQTFVDFYKLAVDVK